MKRNWVMAIIIVMLVTLSCRLPFFESAEPEDQPVISDQDKPGEDYSEEVMTEADFLDEGVYLVSPEGVTVVLPPGGLDESDMSEQISVTALPGEQTSLPEGFDQVGEVYEISSGTDEMLQPATLSLPIPAEVPHEEIIGLTTYSEEQGSWVVVPSFVDSEAGMVTTTVTGFSRWSIARFSRLSTDWKGGWIEVTNQHIHNSGITPPLSGARYSNYTTTYGVCIRGYELDDPATAQSWRHLQDWCLTVSDYASSRMGRTTTMRWRLPAGRYQLEEYAFASERNPGLPSYIPVYGRNYRPLATLELQEGQTARFSNSGDFSGWLGWGETVTAESDGIEDSGDQIDDITTLPWGGRWDVTFNVEAVDYQGPYWENVCADGTYVENFLEVTRFSFFIPEDNDLIPDLLQKQIEESEWPLTLEMEYPNYVYDTPFACQENTCRSGRFMEGSYDETTDSFTGIFNTSHYHEESHIKLTGTWIATRRD